MIVVTLKTTATATATSAAVAMVVTVTTVTIARVGCRTRDLTGGVGWVFVPVVEWVAGWVVEWVEWVDAARPLVR